MNLLSLKIGESVEVLYHPHGKPLPEGYAPVDSEVVDCHLKQYRRIIAPVSHVEHREGGEE